SDLLGTRGHPRGELPRLTGVDVGHKGVAQFPAPPHDHVEAALRRRVRLHGADPRQVARRPREAVGAEDEERDRMQAARVDEHRRLAVPEVADGAALEREVGVTFERHHRREVQPPLEPWFRSEEHTSELQSRFDLVCRLLLEKKKYCTAWHPNGRSNTEAWPPYASRFRKL